MTVWPVSRTSGPKREGETMHQEPAVVLWPLHEEDRSIRMMSSRHAADFSVSKPNLPSVVPCDIHTDAEENPIQTKGILA
ncbi:MAG TPA: hypothetical protein PLR71_13790, partial [Deltaproteobacteria bacterium]|nr:hypothetical protein [Deltaproteobacteria bacterium]